MAIAFVAAWAAKQQNHGGSTLALTAINSTGANFIAVNIECDVTLSATVPVTDSFGNTYQKAYGPDNFTSGDKGYLYYAENPTVGASHVITITATGTAFIAAGGACYSGMATSSTLDQVVAIATGTGTTLTSGTSGATDTANELVIMTGSQDTGSSVTWGAGTGFSLRNSIGNASAGAITFLEDMIVTSTGTQQGTATSTVNANWGCALATFRGPGSGGASGSAAITEGADTVAGTGSVGVSGSAGITEGTDTVSGTGSVGVSGSAAITEGADTVAASGTAGASGSAGITEGSDTVSGTGSVGVSGSAGILEGADAVAASGSATTGATGTAAIAEGADAVAAQGTVGVSGSATVAEAADTVSGQGSVPAAPSTGPVPAGRSKPRRRYYVEVDGVQFDVNTPEEARHILERAKTLAREAAEASALTIQKAQRITTDTIAPVKLSPPKIKASPELRLPLKSVRRSINKIYREKSVILELRMWLELEQRLMEDEDEAMLLLN